MQKERDEIKKLQDEIDLQNAKIKRLKDKQNDLTWKVERQKAWEKHKFPVYDMWGGLDVEIDFPGMHPENNIVDFNIWICEDTGKKYLTFYGWDEKYEQIDTSNIVGSYELVQIEGK